VPQQETTDSPSLKKIRAALPGYEIYEWRHASAVLLTDFKKEWNDFRDVLSRFKLKKSQIVVGGGSKSKMAGWIDKQLAIEKGWQEKQFKTAIKVDENTIESPTHKVDCFNVLARERIRRVRVAVIHERLLAKTLS